LYFFSSSSGSGSLQTVQVELGTASKHLSSAHATSSTWNHRCML